MYRRQFLACCLELLSHDTQGCGRSLRAARLFQLRATVGFKPVPIRLIDISGAERVGEGRLQVAALAVQKPL
jgi:hypothetical protein